MGQTFELNDERVRSIPVGTGDPNRLGAYMAELDAMRAVIVDYVKQDPSDVLLSISGLSARLTEIRADLQRSSSQICTALRTREVDPLRDELELQFRVWSRRIALLEWELKLSGGAT